MVFKFLFATIFLCHKGGILTYVCLFIFLFCSKGEVRARSGRISNGNKNSYLWPAKKKYEKEKFLLLKNKLKFKEIIELLVCEN